MKNTLSLAYIGDSVFDLLWRERAVMGSDAGAHALHVEVTKHVNARAQSEAARLLEPIFTEAEADVFRRGRNSKSASAPKNMDIGDYRRATGLEAVFGYLYVMGDMERIRALFAVITDGA